jgi:hypothetical protein
MFENNNYQEQMIKLDSDLRAVCSIEGVSVGVWDDKSTWRVDYKVEATMDGKKAAQIVVANFKF